MDDIVTAIRRICAPIAPSDRTAEQHLLVQSAQEIERLRALCNDLYHDATCAESFCRLCGEGIREWEADRG